MPVVPSVATRVAVLFAALSLACSPNSQGQTGAAPDARQAEPVACTMMFAMIGVRVADSALRPVSGVEVTVTRRRTGETRSIAPTDTGDVGAFVIADDSMREQIAAEGEAFEVRARAGGRQAAARYMIGLTEGRCHVTKLSGPDTLVLQ